MALETATRAELRAKFEELSRTGDPRLRQELIEGHLRLAQYLARRFANRGEPTGDLVQVGSLALVKAVDRFDPKRGVEFSTYATQTIVGELKRHFRDKGWSVRAPRRLQELSLRLGKVLGELSQQFGRSPTIAELASATGTSEEEVLEALEAGQAYRSSSLDAPAPGEEARDESLASHLGQEDEGFVAAEERVTLSPLVSSLPGRQQQILRMRFWEGRTQSEIARTLGISQMHVSRLLSRSLGELRNAVAEPERDPPGPGRR